MKSNDAAEKIHTSENTLVNNYHEVKCQYCSIQFNDIYCCDKFFLDKPINLFPGQNGFKWFDMDK